MESASWRRYRGHLIIARTTGLGRRRHDVWRDGRLVGTLRSALDAELFIDASARLPRRAREGRGSGAASQAARRRKA